jgi:hypothetical protein
VRQVVSPARLVFVPRPSAQARTTRGDLQIRSRVARSGCWTVLDDEPSACPLPPRSRAEHRAREAEKRTQRYSRSGRAGSNPWAAINPFIVRAAVRDSAWPKPTRVHWSGRGGAMWLHLIQLPESRSSEGRLALLWGRKGDRRGAVDSVLLMASIDHGRSWGPPAALAAPAGLAALVARSDRSGNVHVVIQEAPRLDPPAAGDLRHLTWTEGVWHTNAEFDVGRADSYPQLSQLGSDSLLLTWGIARPVAGQRTEYAPAGLSAVLRIACGRGPGG